MLPHVTQHSMEIDAVLHFTGDETGQRGLNSTSSSKAKFYPGPNFKMDFLHLASFESIVWHRWKERN